MRNNWFAFCLLLFSDRNAEAGDEIPPESLYFDKLKFIRRGKMRANDDNKPLWKFRINVLEDLAYSGSCRSDLKAGGIAVQAKMPLNAVSLLRYRNCLIVIEPEGEPGVAADGCYTFETEKKEDISLSLCMCHSKKKKLPWSECIDFQTIVIGYDHNTKAYLLKYITKPVIFHFTGSGISPTRVAITTSTDFVSD